MPVRVFTDLYWNFIERHDLVGVHVVRIPMDVQGQLFIQMLLRRRRPHFAGGTGLRTSFELALFMELIVVVEALDHRR